MAIDAGISGDWRAQTAQRIVAELAQDPQGERLTKVSSLLHAFSCPGVHSDVGDLLRSLKAADVAVGSANPHISRRDVIELKLREAPSVSSAAEDQDSAVRLTRWRQGVAGEPSAFDAEQPVPEAGEDEVLWFDIDPLGAEPTNDVVHELTSRLRPSCPGLSERIVRDVLTADLLPKTEAYGDEHTGVRTVSVAALIAREVPDEDDDFDGYDEHLLTQMVEIVVGPRWLITCWHPCRVLVGGGQVHEAPSLLREPFLANVAHRWIHDRVDESRAEAAKEATDLATYLARSLVATYGASLRMLQRWVSTWEVEFYKAIGDPEHEHLRAGRDQRKLLKDAAVEISNFLAVVGEFSRSVNALQLAGEEMPNKTWFPSPQGLPGDPSGQPPVSEQSTTLSSAVEAASRKLDQLSLEIRADMDLLMIHSQARQQESSEKLQGYLGKVTGLILVPTFVAGLYGANTALPGGGSWMGFEIMLLLMCASAALSYFVIRRLIG